MVDTDTKTGEREWRRLLREQQKADMDIETVDVVVVESKAMSVSTVMLELQASLEPSSTV